MNPAEITSDSINEENNQFLGRIESPKSDDGSFARACIGARFFGPVDGDPPSAQSFLEKVNTLKPPQKPPRKTLIKRNTVTGNENEVVPCLPFISCSMMNGVIPEDQSTHVVSASEPDSSNENYNGKKGSSEMNCARSTTRRIVREEFAMLLTNVVSEQLDHEPEVTVLRHFKISVPADDGFLPLDVVKFRMYLAKFLFKYTDFHPIRDNWLCGLFTKEAGPEIRTLENWLKYDGLLALLKETYIRKNDIGIRSIFLQGRLKAVKWAWRIRHRGEDDIYRAKWIAQMTCFLNFEKSRQRVRWVKIVNEMDALMPKLGECFSAGESKNEILAFLKEIRNFDLPENRIDMTEYCRLIWALAGQFAAYDVDSGSAVENP